MDYFQTVDQTNLWRRHVVWAKPNGKQLRDITTQRFSTISVFLSLLLTAQLGVLFNSSKITTTMRASMMEQAYFDIHYWMGAILAASSCLSVIGLVATFTAWGMIHVISDGNTHCLLRSSMGLYVTSLPPRFAVSALYLFLLFLLLFIATVFKGPFGMVVLIGMIVLFFKVVVALSAFGRLIIHTGAMGRRKVLHDEFERQLVPSGLHVALLIRAMQGYQRSTSLVPHYDKGKKKSRFRASDDGQRRRADEGVAGTSFATTSSGQTAQSDRQNALKSPSSGHQGITVPEEEPPLARPPLTRLSTTSSIDSVDAVFSEIKFPRPSVLNKTSTRDATDLVEQTLQLSSPLAEASQQERNDSLRYSDATTVASHHEEDIDETRTPRVIRGDRFWQESVVLNKHGANRNWQRMLNDWQMLEDIRLLYEDDTAVHERPSISRRLSELTQEERVPAASSNLFGSLRTQGSIDPLLRTVREEPKEAQDNTAADRSEQGADDGDVEHALSGERRPLLPPEPPDTYGIE